MAGEFLSLPDFAPLPSCFHLVRHCPEVPELVRARPRLTAWSEDVIGVGTVAQECIATTKAMEERLGLVVSSRTDAHSVCSLNFSIAANGRTRCKCCATCFYSCKVPVQWEV